VSAKQIVGMSFFKDLTKNFEQLSATLGGDKKKEKIPEAQQQQQGSYGMTGHCRLFPGSKQVNVFLTLL
jgi:hypothetical protein